MRETTSSPGRDSSIPREAGETARVVGRDPVSWRELKAVVNPWEWREVTQSVTVRPAVPGIPEHACQFIKELHRC